MVTVTDLSAAARMLTLQAEDAVRQQLAHLKQLQAVNNSLDDLKGLLGELPDKTSHSVVVPFGKAAFFPGKLVHTNECIVHLGADMHVERSAQQTIELLNRRQTVLGNTIKAAEKELDVMKARLAALSETVAEATTADSGEGLVEISEEYDAWLHSPMHPAGSAGASAGHPAQHATQRAAQHPASAIGLEGVARRRSSGQPEVSTPLQAAGRPAPPREFSGSSISAAAFRQLNEHAAAAAAASRASHLQPLDDEDARIWARMEALELAEAAADDEDEGTSAAGTAGAAPVHAPPPASAGPKRGKLEQFVEAAEQAEQAEVAQTTGRPTHTGVVSSSNPRLLSAVSHGPLLSGNAAAARRGRNVVNMAAEDMSESAGVGGVHERLPGSPRFHVGAAAGKPAPVAAPIIEEVEDKPSARDRQGLGSDAAPQAASRAAGAESSEYSKGGKVPVGDDGKAALLRIAAALTGGHPDTASGPSASTARTGSAPSTGSAATPAQTRVGNGTAAAKVAADATDTSALDISSTPPSKPPVKPKDRTAARAAVAKGFSGLKKGFLSSSKPAASGPATSTAPPSSANGKPAGAGPVSGMQSGMGSNGRGDSSSSSKAAAQNAAVNAFSGVVTERSAASTGHDAFGMGSHAAAPGAQVEPVSAGQESGEPEPCAPKRVSLFKQQRMYD